MTDLLQKTLVSIASILNRHQIRYAVGGSVLLALEGYQTECHDIDLLVCEADATEARRLLLSLGTEVANDRSDAFKTKHFHEFLVDGIEVDLISGFVIATEEGDYYFPLSETEKRKMVVVDGENIPLDSLDKWRIYYRLMGRLDKLDLLEKPRKKGD